MEFKNVLELKKTIEKKYPYWEMDILKFECNHFLDEIELIYEDYADYDGNTIVVLKFIGCYKIISDHAKVANGKTKVYAKHKPVKEMTASQRGYILHSIKIEEVEIETLKFLIFKIDMSSMDVEIWCQNIEVFKKDKRE